MGGERHHFCTEVFPFAVGFGWRSQFSKSNARGLRSSCCYKCDEWQVDPLGIGKGRSITFGSAEKLGIATRVSTVSLGEFPWWVDGSSKEFKNRRCCFSPSVLNLKDLILCVSTHFPHTSDDTWGACLESQANPQSLHYFVCIEVYCLSDT